MNLVIRGEASDFITVSKGAKKHKESYELGSQKYYTIVLSALSTMLGVRMHLCTTFILLLILLLVLSLSCILYALWYSGN